MQENIKKLLIGASVAAGMSAIASSPAFATSLRPTDIQFNTTNINSWLYKNPSNPTMDATGIGGVSRKVLDDYSNYGNTAKAIQALTDTDSATNVELWTQGEAVTANVGFSAKLGSKNIKVESVTQADWASGDLAQKWVNGFLGTYGGVLQSLGVIPTDQQKTAMVDTLKTKGMYSSGDPNIGDVTLDDQTGQLKVDLVGHLDRSSLYLNSNGTRKNDPRYDTGNPLLNDALFNVSRALRLQGKYFQVSEVAKVTFDGNVDYAFGFSALDSGAIAGDRNKTSDTTSHTGIYRWTKKFDQPPSESVPEPSTLLGLLAVGGLFATGRKTLKKA
jgi:PEP-CTERM motif